LTVVLEVFPESNLASVNHHQILWTVEFTTEFCETNVLLCSLSFSALSLSLLIYTQVVDIVECDKITVEFADFTEVYLTTFEEDGLEFARINKLFFLLSICCCDRKD